MSMQYTVKGNISRSIHDIKCPKCGDVQMDACVNTEHMPACRKCNVYYEIRWDLSERKSNVIIDPNIAPRDRAVVYINPHTGSPAYPGQDTEFTRQKYEGWGYQRKEFETMRELDKFCDKHKVVNERSNFNSGNGIN